ncbi:hypothetical protein [Lutibacter sp.]|uniref:hypothetical protein n=1 Tax=Lutibacter sp. TaxID=1925666 RepID=UPI0035663161
MKTTFKILVICLSILWLNNSCSKDDSPILVIDDYFITIHENPINDQLIGTIPSEINSNRELYYSFSIISQSAENAIILENGGYFSTEMISIYVNDKTVFDFETNPIIIATIKVNAVSYKLDFSQEIHDTKTITITINLNDLAD